MAKTSFNSITDKRLIIGERIRQARNNCGYTQQKVADELSKKLYKNNSDKDTITAQSISYWENGNYLPSTENLILLSEVLGVSVSSLVEDRPEFKYGTKQVFFDVDRTYKRVQNAASMFKLKNTIKALPFADKAHKGVTLKNADIPYISHPLTMACHLLAMDIKDDAIIAATLLHDVVEDTDYTIDDLPVDDETKELVNLLTCIKDSNKSREEVLKPYYAAIKTNPKAALIKLVDRCNNISKMVWGLSHERIHRMVNETEDYVLPLLDVIKNGEYDNASYLLAYQIKTTLDIYKRLM